MSSVATAQPIHCANRSEWLYERRQGICASDAAAVLGVNPWKSPYMLWAEKVRGVDDAQNSEPIYWGSRLEPIVRDEFQAKAGKLVSYPGAFTVFQNCETPWMRASLDGIVLADDSDDPIAVYEGKTTSAFNDHEWKEGPPLHYSIQCQHQMLVMGLPRAYLAVLVGGQRFHWYEVERNERFIQALSRKEREFWNLVQTETPPPPDGHASTSKALALLHPDDNGFTVDLPAEAVEKDARFVLVKEQIKTLEAEKDELSNWFKAAIGSASFGRMANGESYSLKTQEWKESVVAASKFRVLKKQAKRKGS